MSEIVDKDHLLRHVMRDLHYIIMDYLPRSLGDLEHVPAEVKGYCRRLRLILSRSKEELTDFGGFYCLRLMLDQQSPLASYFIDLFSHLEFLLLCLRSMFKNDLGFYCLRHLSCINDTCRLLYATSKMLLSTAKDPLCQSGGPSVADEQFKRKGRRQGRQFSSNLLHSRMRHIASVYLDQEGCSRLSLKEELGEGASAKVYRGAFEDPDSHGCLKGGSFVAVKMFNDGDIAGSSALGSMFGSRLLQSMQRMTNHLNSNTDNFLAELDKLVIAKHPNIVIPLGYIGKRTEGECGLVMELMDGSLLSYLEKVSDGRVPPLKEVDMLDLMLEIARGMRFLHECNLIHLDLKPSNVLLRFSDGEEHPREVKIADLGVTELSSFFADGKKGTSYYMAPEIRGASSLTEVRIDDKMDVFSYGTTCFNILMGNPDTCASSESVTLSKFYEAVKTGCWKRWVKGRNPFLVKLIGRCWEMDPSKRPTFATLCILLQHAIQTLLAPSSLYEVTGCLCPDSMTLLKKFNDSKELVHLQFSNKIRSLLPGCVALEVIERHLLHFESLVTRNVDLLPLDKKLSSMERLLGKAHSEDDGGEFGSALAADHLESCRYLDYDGQTGSEKVATDVSIFLNFLANGHFKRAISSRNKTIGTPWWKWFWRRGSHLKNAKMKFRNTVMESCLNEADPLILIKVEAYLKVLERIYYNARSEGISSQKRYDLFKFEEDEARVPLQVDTSLIPLLVAFWHNRTTFS